MEDKTFELLTKMYSEFINFKNEITSKVGNLSENMSTVNDKIDNLSEQVKKNSVTLENVQDKLQTMVETQESHYEENQRHHQEIVELLTEKITTVEIAVKNANIKAVK